MVTTALVMIRRPPWRRADMHTGASSKGQAYIFAVRPFVYRTVAREKSGEKSKKLVPSGRRSDQTSRFGIDVDY
jgi:hypothetical protein